MGGTHGQYALVFDFDSLQQRQLWESETTEPFGEDQYPPTGVTRRFSGLLRTADVLTKRIILPDAQLLDGALFLHHGPELVRSLLGRNIYDRLDIKVVGRDASLAESLRKMVLGSKDQDRLAVFEFSSLAVFGLDPRELAQRVSKRASQRVRDCLREDIPAVVAAEFQAAAEGLETIEEPSGIFARMARQWSAWITEFAHNTDAVCVWDANRFSMADAFDARPMPSALASLIEVDNDVLATVNEVKGIKGRSSLKARLAELEPVVLHSAAGLLDGWWSSAYFDALAKQHQCSWLRLESSMSDSIHMESSHAEGTVSVQFEGSLIGTFGEMPAPTYASTKYAARDAISRWAASPVEKNSDGLAFAIMKFNETFDRLEIRRALWVRILLTLLPAVLGAIVGHWVSTAAGLLALVLTAAGVLLAAPIADLLELHSLRSKKMKSVINIPGGTHDTSL